MYKINLELSNHLANKYKNKFKAKECYQNVFKLITEVSELGAKKDVKVLYCYAHNGYFYYRHAFCLFRNEIIEPLKNVIKYLNVSYIIQFAKLNINSYFSFIITDQRYDLIPSLYLKEIETINKHKDQMKALNPIDMSYLVCNIAKTGEEHLRILNDIISGRGIIGFK